VINRPHPLHELEDGVRTGDGSLTWRHRRRAAFQSTCVQPAATTG
jgi:hypothetical protein